MGPPGMEASTLSDENDVKVKGEGLIDRLCINEFNIAYV